MDNREIITSPENKYYKLLKSLSKAKYRQETGLFLAEGLRLVADLIIAGEKPEILVYTPRFSETSEGESLLSLVDRSAVKVFSDDLFAQLAETVSPQGIIAAFPIPDRTEEDIWQSHFGGAKFVLCLDGLQDPGNMGTIIRTCGAFGFSLVLSKGCVDPYNPKVVRASMGGLVKVPVLTQVNLPKFLKGVPEDLPIYVTSPNGRESLLNVDARNGCVLVVGSEASGVSPEVAEIAERTFFIPMLPGSESLNAAVATAITLFEAVRNHL